MSKERYCKGSHTVSDFKNHFVWKTKDCYGVLRGEIGTRLRDIIREICAEKELDIVKGNVRPNHIHVMVRAASHLSPAKIMQYLKGKSSYRLQRDSPQLRKSYWAEPVLPWKTKCIYFLNAPKPTRWLWETRFTIAND